MKIPMLKLRIIIAIIFSLISIILFIEVDWNLILNSTKFIKEMRLPALFLGLAIYLFWDIKNTLK